MGAVGIRVTRSLMIVALLAVWEIYGRFFANSDLVAPPSRVLAVLGPKILGGIAENPWTSVLLFFALAASLFVFARKKME